MVNMDETSDDNKKEKNNRRSFRTTATRNPNNKKQQYDTTTTTARTSEAPVTAGDIRRELLRNPAPFFDALQEASRVSKNKSRRTRKRVDQPQQQYVYASQKQQQQQQQQSKKVNVIDASEKGNDVMIKSDEESNASTKVMTTTDRVNTSTNSDLTLAKLYGMIPSTQHCDPIPYEVPKIVAYIRVSNPKSDDADDIDNTNVGATATTAMAYMIEKPMGWSILGTKASSSSSSISTPSRDTIATTTTTKSNPNRRDKHTTTIKRVSVKNDDGSFGGYMEYNEADVLALMTPEEMEDYTEQTQSEASTAIRNSNNKVSSPSTTTTPTAIDPQSSVSINLALAPSTMDNTNDFGDVNENDSSSLNVSDVNESEESTELDPNTDIDPKTLANLRRIIARSASSTSTTTDTMASFASTTRPSVISWLKEIKAAEGTPIRGGNYWTAMAGAVDVDDTGLVLLCPKANTNNVCIEYAEYVAVVGNGGVLDPTANKSDKVDVNKKSNMPETATVEVIAKLRRGRGDDTVETVKVTIPERASTCSNVIRLCQEQCQDGIRGDPASSPFDRRAQRRLIHCNAMSISSHTYDDTIEMETDRLPDDIAVLSERRNHLEYKNGSFLGRSTLRDNPHTTAYREINGAADGFPGWTVDRYGDYLLAYHDTKHPRGPLPSIHDGNTIGVYYLETKANRSTMGSELDARPRLLEGRPAPDSFPIRENGVQYLVSLNRDLSTGIFLDQRLHRAWLYRNCGPNTRILNCFAHTGAFSVAAAAAGASTVSLDLSTKWLNRLPEQLSINDIEFDERHDCIYGDCFDWLVRLAKRNELYDIVILDPPSTSIGQKRKRWSIQDMDELVALAVPLVKKGGFLWTTTNSGNMPITKFAKLCKKGLADAGISNAKLERIQPMPTDFSSVGPQPVKNLVWRIP
jgi:23S rRNA (cytosine1962-C5)-methyltransferase